MRASNSSVLARSEWGTSRIAAGVQLLLGCSALNLKRIVAHAGEAATGAAAGPRTVKAEAVEASGEASTRSAGVSWHRITLTAGAGAANTHIIAPAWTIGLSLNGGHRSGPEPSSWTGP